MTVTGRVRQLLDDHLRIADAAAGIDENGMVSPISRFRHRVLVMARLHDGIEIIGDLHDVEPVVIDRDALWLREGWFGQLIQHEVSESGRLHHLIRYCRCEVHTD